MQGNNQNQQQNGHAQLTQEEVRQSIRNFHNFILNHAVNQNMTAVQIQQLEAELAVAEIEYDQILGFWW